MLDDYLIEEQRKERLMADLEKARREAPARKVRIPAAHGVAYRTVETLPPAIHLRPGELLRIVFFGAQDLAAQLYELSQAMGNDWAAFEAAVEEPEKTKAAGSK
ncbi:MAG TPA: hypothetical protein VHY84_27275 [Bryobacteraceae bacterium]|jgi:hypothetical protein|nr:hypothetical protein [Bryobacteraceae bacterium]